MPDEVWKLLKAEDDEDDEDTPKDTAAAQGGSRQGTLHLNCACVWVNYCVFCLVRAVAVEWGYQANVGYCRYFASRSALHTASFAETAGADWR
jgi:hypothetical protein